MAYFPAFLKLDGKKILIVGGGNIAYEKLEHLLDFTKDIHVVAQEYSDAMMECIEKEKLTWEKRAYKEGDIKDFAMVVIAVDNIALQAEIFEESKKYNCLCNAVDSVDYCDFIFPSYIKEDDLIIAISTSGASPAVAKHLRRYLQKMIPSSIAEFLKEMKVLRTRLPKGKERMKMLDEKAKNYIQNWSK
ncbi:bifunctional precorrin-2 dehydrogenase/sirohydrochlorin ferrochelatase [Sulfurimonas sp. SWIR-19]|uniref:precorrin-2 dehydrogenase/sirohydrochlorin ferrochelatase family protein n=1 Tax=Sulfurimonas sp. SWIR-19 TaxID=2878390 RepID=UPI001CF53F7B|nr:bifunctional precorrin-2 dehydrogenase/sirohydrochlorin ferrochelatase [Sulfurimonas sp. SWIR-19]UCM99563.1 bifunctional precorrin-2 dehydrogenase/sirohydrochlorin ferrochelatase [Sulfurimonas sp. SWIR-19]